MENGKMEFRPNIDSLRRSPWIFCIPSLLAISIIALLPLLRTFYFSFTDAKLITLDRFHWVAFENFTFLLQDPDWWQALRNTLLFTLASVSIETLLGLAFALFLNQEFKGRKLLRTAILVPWVIPSIVAAKIWAWMFNDLYGVINEVLIQLGVIHTRLAWLADPTLSFLTLIIVDVWKTAPFMTLLILAGLQGVPKSVLEAAEIDGASRVQRLLYVTLPLIRRTLWVAILFRMLDALRIFDLPYVLTSNSKTTAVASTYIKQQLVDFQEIGYGSAASFALFCIIGSISALYLLGAPE
jgi:trehalose/maltose transport system permease protein